MNKCWIILISLVGALLPASGGFGQADGNVEKKVLSVTAAAPTARDIDYTLSALGSVESINSPTVAAETSGRITVLDADVGTSVVESQALAAIDNSLHEIQTAEAKAELESQKVQLENQRRLLERVQELSKSNSVSRNRLDNEDDKLRMLQAQKEVAQKRYEHARKLESHTRVVAPIAGSIAKRYVSVGDYVSAGQALFDLVSVERLRARLNFPERNAANIRIGQEVQLQSPAAPQSPAIGHVAQINPRINAGNRAIEVLVEFDNPDTWLPGGSVDARLIVKQSTGALTIPPLSVVKRNDSDVVFVVENGRVSARPVRLGWVDADWVEISEGISPTDRVVVEGAALLSGGSHVIENAELP